MMRSSELRGVRVVLVPVGVEHVPELRRILLTPEVRSRWRDEAAAPRWPFDDRSATRFAVLVETAVRGMIQYGRKTSPTIATRRSTSSLIPSCMGTALAVMRSPLWLGT